VVAHKGGNQTDPVYVANLRWMGHRSQFGLPFHSGKVYALSVLDGTVKGGAQLQSLVEWSDNHTVGGTLAAQGIDHRAACHLVRRGSVASIMVV
jgi:hypothetical protein